MNVFKIIPQISQGPMALPMLDVSGIKENSWCALCRRFTQAKTWYLPAGRGDGPFPTIILCTVELFSEEINDFQLAYVLNGIATAMP